MSAIQELAPYISAYHGSIKQAKEDQHYTIDRLVDESGVSRLAVTKLCAGTQQDPKLYNSAALCRVLRLSLDELFGLVQPAESPEELTEQIHHVEIENAKLEATAAAQGERTRTCLNCSHQQTEVLHATGKFEDVPAGSYYEEAVIWAAEEGITSGTDTTHFSPDSICTRAQAVTFLWRAAGSPAPETSTMPFTDVSVGSYYYDAVLWAAENGITAGTSKTTFSPNADCTRAHIVSFLWRSEKYPAAEGSNPFTDVAPTAYYATAVQWAVANRITAGTSETTFSPNAGCTRAQIVTFLWRWMK